jgi:hypothetical protein
MDRWEPPVELTKQEQMIMKRLSRVRTLFGFLRLNVDFGPLVLVGLASAPEESHEMS